MPTLRDTAAAWLQHGQSAIVVEVNEARGSVPREVGTRMLVSAAACAGTIGGGNLEWQAVAKARDMLRTPMGPLQSQHLALGPALGQCCGGAVTLRYAMLDAEALARWPHPAPWFHLQLFGAGHVGRAIVRALAPLPVHVTWIDERETEFAESTACDAASPATSAHPVRTAGTQARIERVCIDTIEAEVQHAPAAAFYLVLTHQHDLDLRIVEAILRRGDFAFLGLIGSRTKRQRFVHRFEERGVDKHAIERLTCPIGVPGIHRKEPEAIAAAVVAQLLQQRSAD